MKMEIDTKMIYLISTVIIGVIALIGVFKKMNGGFGPFNLKVYGLTLVVIISAILVLSDIEVNKLTASYSILGAIAGYLFGISNSKDKNN